MSTEDVKKYFQRYSTVPFAAETTDEELFNVKWINDSYCVIKLPSAEQAAKAYFELKLSEPRVDDCLPPLNDYLQELKAHEQKMKEKQA